MTSFVPRLFGYRASGNCFKVRATLRLLDVPFERVPAAGCSSSDPSRRRAAVMRLTGRDDDEREVAEALASGTRLLAYLDELLTGRRFLVADTPSVAGLSLYAYAHVAEDAGFELSEHVALRAWLDAVASLPGFVNDLVPYPDNARPGRSRSIYD